MPAPNKLYVRKEIRSELFKLEAEQNMWLIKHRDAYRHDPNHDELRCHICANHKGVIEGLQFARRHFGGHRG